jgi:hypothetical protein
MSEEQNSGDVQQESSGMSLVSNTLAIIGFIILLVIVIWGVFNIVKLSNIAHWFKSSPALTVTAPAGISEQPLTISWKNTSTAAGTYAFVYGCSDSAVLAAPTTGSPTPIPCGVSLNTGSSTSAVVVPLLKSGSASSTLDFSIVFTPQNGGEKITGGTKLSIAPSSSNTSGSDGIVPVPVSTGGSGSTVTSPPSSHATTPASVKLVNHAASGPADLSVTIIATGYIDPGSGALLMNRPPQPGDTVGVEFDIANVGGSASGSYTFAAHLPTTAAYTYNSPAQRSLAPGEHVVSTLRFTQLAPGGGLFTVSVGVGDANVANNEASVTIQ